MREERRHVVVVFADIVGSTSVGERFDPEDAREIVGGAVERIVRTIERWDGRVKDLAGDGVLSLFGAPVAHEDDHERAVHAGLEIVEEVAAYRDEIRPRYRVDDLNVRVGVQSGLAASAPMEPASASSTAPPATS